MRIESCYIENFGKFHQVSMEFSENLTMLVKENGWGKTTLAAFLEAMFYGLAANTRGVLAENMRKRYQPWQAGIFGGSLVFVSQCGRFQVQRQFGMRPKEDVFLLIDLETGMESRAYSEKLGEELFGMDRTTYRFTTYFRQKNMQLGKTDALFALLGKQATEEDQTEGFEKAIKRLDDAIRIYKKTGGRGKIDELICEREEWTHALAQASFYEDEPLVGQQIEEGRRHFGEWSPAKMESQQELLEEGIFQCEELAKQEKEISLKQAQYEVIAQLEVKPPKMQEVSRSEGGYGWLWIAAVIFLASILLGIWVSPFGFALATVGIACLWLHKKKETVLDKRYQQERQKAKEAWEEAYSLAKEARASELAHRKRVIAELQEENASLEQNIRNQLVRYHMEESHNLMTTFVMLKEALLNYGQLCAKQEEGQKERKIQIERRLAEVEEKIAQAKVHYEELCLTKKMLIEAKERYANRYLMEARKGFIAYQEQIFGEAKATLTSDLAIQVWEDGFYRELAYYSEGTKDVLILCARLALVEAMFEQETPYLVLDDAFSELDEKNQQRVCTLLEKMGEKRQILCFNCRAMVPNVNAKYTE
ncbi:AAA domain-containing protein [Lachnospiraceae bacterium XBB1006]|nr:AAA domain-containing protein [Lachnospiraceae bacterium XBB1006]